MTWQDISTAPRDGSLMLLSDANWPHAAHRGGAPVKVGGFWHDKWNIFGASWEPTHWMPLPEPPLPSPPEGR